MPPNARNTGRRDNRGPKEPKEPSDTVEKVVFINRCAKVVKGGRRFSFSALIVTGDHKGRVGCGFGKAKEVSEAIRKASDSARKAMRKETGARGLRSIMEDVMLDIMFDLPENQGSTYVINERNVEGTEPVLPARETRTKSA